MSLLDMLKSLLGRGSSQERRAGQPDVGVTVEHEPGDVDPETATEEAVKGTDLSGGTETRTESGHDGGRGSEPATQTEGGTVDIPDAEELASDSGSSQEQDESVEIPDAERIEGVDEPGGEAGAEAEPSKEQSEAAGAEADVDPETADEPTDVVKGIGATYAERLTEAGIETVGDLAAADPAEVAEEADVSESRLERWVQRARDR